ncbi:MAG TPA: hypothetical protein VM261_20435 [Kofleriaceae bacterium]|nr:hypothetical protein [Kofleriaceae bacterium]
MRVTDSVLCAAGVVGLGLAACGGDDGGGGNPDAALPAWDRGLPPSSVMGSHRGLQAARGIIHLHSPYSHDACDGDPRPGGVVDEACLADLRAALCDTRQDYAALTDHDDAMADQSFEDLFVRRGGDTLIMGTDGPIANRMMCPDGPGALVTVGGENPLMPIMLDRHVTGTVQERHDIYNGESVVAITAMRDAGATLWVPHTEQRTTAELMMIAPDGIEIYQLHANLDPDIRAEHLGLPAAGAIQAVAEFADTNPGGPEPDLALLSFLAPNTPSLARWDELLGMGRRVSGSGGTDAHQNALPILLKDGERGDSYRRMLRWFSNVALVSDRADIGQIEYALRNGRMYVAFEIMGTPVGFDVSATAGATTFELGGTFAPTAGATLNVTVPTIHELPADLPAPEIRARIIRVTASGATEVASGAGPTLSTPLDTVGAYRVEVLIKPHHWGPYLRQLGTAYADQELPWIYASPFYVVP